MIIWNIFTCLIVIINLSHQSAVVDYKDLFDVPENETKAVPDNESISVATGDETTSNPDYDIFITSDEPETTPRITTMTPSPRTTTVEVTTEEPWEDPDICELNEKCVYYEYCEKDKVNSDGSFLIDERLDAPTEEIKWETCPQLHTCCKKSEYLCTFKNISAKENYTLFEEQKIKEICSYSSNTPVKCGFRNPKGIGRSVQGMQNSTFYSQYAEFPWMMAVLVERKVNDDVLPIYQCGGSLIHPKVVMTTAHNIARIDKTKFIIRGGEWNSQTENESCKHVDKRVQKINRHDQFNRSILKNDIALLILKDEFEMTPYINIVCLPLQGATFDGQRCLTCGWGKDKFGNVGIRQVFLKKVELPIVPRKKCEDQLRKTILGPNYNLQDGSMCAGGEEGKDLCTGDGGSPLMCEIPSSPGHYYQAGIVIGGVGCGEKDVPGTYVEVAKYRNWIDEKMTKLGFAVSYTI